MPEINHKLLKKYLKDLKSDPAKEFAAVYLLFGEELLVKNAFDELLDALLPAGNRSANYDPVEGTIENIYDVIESINTFSLLPGTKVVAMRESRIFYQGYFIPGIIKADYWKMLRKLTMTMILTKPQNTS
jgi:DNA polymerase-3 subunit delta